MPDEEVAACLTELERKLEALELELQTSRRAPAHGGRDSAAHGADAAGEENHLTGHRAGSGSPFAAALASSPSPFAASPETPPAAPYASSPEPPAESPAPPPSPTAPAASPPPAPAPPPSRDPAVPHSFVASPPLPPRHAAAPERFAIDDPGPGTARMIADVRAELGGLDAHLDALGSFRDELERVARELLSEYDRLVRGLRATAALEVEERTASPAATALDGLVTIDAGPFTNMTPLAALEQALAVLPGVRDVHVRAFDHGRAQIDVILGERVALGLALGRSLSLPFVVTRADPGHVSIEMS